MSMKHLLVLLHKDLPIDFNTNSENIKFIILIIYVNINVDRTMYFTNKSDIVRYFGDTSDIIIDLLLLFN